MANDESEVRNAHVDVAIALAVQKAQHSIKSDYQKATRSTRQESLFAEVLLACALAPKDDLGYHARTRVGGPINPQAGSLG